MSPGLMALVVLLSLLAVMLTGLPMAFTLLGLGAMGYLIFVGPQALYGVIPNMFGVVTKDVFLAIPLFVLMATILDTSGLGRSLYDMMYKWAAGLRGGLAIGTVAICTFLAAMTGLGGTGTLMMGVLAYPEMRRRGYDKRLAIGTIPPAGALGQIIPPSVMMILLGGFAQLSVGKLFIGGIIPGLLIAFGFIIYLALRCSFNPKLAPAIPVSERASWREKFASLRGSVLPLILILVVLGGIYTGVCTPTEAGGIGAFGALVSALVYRQYSWRKFMNSSKRAFQISGMIFWILIGGTVFTSFLSISGVTSFIADWLVQLELAPFGIVAVMMAVTFALGMIIEGSAIIMVFSPIFFPVIIMLGFDPLWFGIVFLINLVIGMVTPPFGWNLFYFKGLQHADVSMLDIYRSVWPYVGVMLIALIICVVFPEIVLWLPNMMIK